MRLANEEKRDSTQAEMQTYEITDLIAYIERKLTKQRKDFLWYPGQEEYKGWQVFRIQLYPGQTIHYDQNKIKECCLEAATRVFPKCVIEISTSWCHNSFEKRFSDSYQECKFFIKSA